MDLAEHFRTLIDTPSDINMCKQIIQRELEVNDDFREALTDWAINVGVLSLIYRERRILREAARSGNVPGVSTDALKRGARRTFNQFLDGYAIGNKALGDCCRADLIASADKKESTAAGLSHAARFERMVADRLKSETQTVRKVLKESELFEINASAGQSRFEPHQSHVNTRKSRRNTAAAKAVAVV